MVDLRPFTGLRYNTALVGQDLSAVTCPPYDVISPAERGALLARDPHNVVRLELPQADEPGGDPYRAAARSFGTWVAERTLLADGRPSLYAYRVDFTVDGVPCQRRGLIAALRLDASRRGMVRPHERTLPGPKQDRLALMRACRANFSPIWCLYRDRDGATADFWRHVTSLEPSGYAVDGDHVAHVMWAVTDPGVVAQMCAAFSEAPVYIADGHHRYETALSFQSEVQGAGVRGAEAAQNFAMTYFVESSDPGLVVLGTHRLLRLPRAQAERLTLVRDALASSFDVSDGPRSARGLLDTLAGAGDGGAFGVWAPATGLSVIARLRGDGLVPADLAYGHSDAWRRLDLAALHTQLIEYLYPEGAAALVEKGLLRYARSLDEVEKELARDDASIGLLVRPTPVAHIIAVADAEDRMPEKSTYFFPKPVTGLVIASLDGTVRGLC